MGIWVAFTTSLVAAITPAFPLASRNCTLAELWAAAYSFTAAVTAERVSALWSLRKIMIGMTLASALSSPVAVSMGETVWARACWSRGRMRHLSEPSFQPALTILATAGSEMTDWTPGTRRTCPSKRSISVTTSWSTQPLGTVVTMTDRMSTPMLNFEVMIRVSLL
jgi:hypothetical protein